MPRSSVLTKKACGVPPGAEVLRAAQAGDRTAQDRIYRSYRRLLHRQIAAYCTPSLREDVVQDSFLAAFTTSSPFRGKASVSTYLTSIARHRARRKARGPHLVAYDQGVLEGMLEAQAVPGPDLASQTSARCYASTIGASLSVEQLQIVRECILNELSASEAATRLRVPAGTVKSRLAAARRKLYGEAEGKKEARECMRRDLGW